MSGPIVRTGTNPKFWSNWDNIFGGKSAKGSPVAKGEAKAPKKKAAKKAAKKKAAKKK